VKLKIRKHCPRCGSTELLTTNTDQLCCKCDWDTFAEYVNSGLMDNLAKSYHEHFEEPPGDIESEPVPLPMTAKPRAKCA
jgi:ribosomal protein S27AE